MAVNHTRQLARTSRIREIPAIFAARDDTPAAAIPKRPARLLNPPLASRKKRACLPHESKSLTTGALKYVGQITPGKGLR
jgi:hypothetical protein